MTDPNQNQVEIVKASEKPMEFVPYGAGDKIKLTIGIVRDLIAVPSKSGKLPSPRDCIKFMMLCSAKRLNPFENDAYLLGYDRRDGSGADFSLITAHQAYLKRAELNPEYDGMESGVIIQNKDGSVQELEGDFHLDDQSVVGGWAKVSFKSRKVPTKRRVRLKRFQKQYGVWQDDPAGMICKCAEADALRSSFPTMLGGLYMREEIEVHSERQPYTPLAVLDAPKATEQAAVAAIAPLPPDPKPPPKPPKPTNKAPAPPEEPPGTVHALKAKLHEAGITEAEFFKWAHSVQDESFKVPGDIMTIDQLDEGGYVALLEHFNTTWFFLAEMVKKERKPGKLQETLV